MVEILISDPESGYTYYVDVPQDDPALAYTTPGPDGTPVFDDNLARDQGDDQLAEELQELVKPSPYGGGGGSGGGGGGGAKGGGFRALPYFPPSQNIPIPTGQSRPIPQDMPVPNIPAGSGDFDVRRPPRQFEEAFRIQYPPQPSMSPIGNTGSKFEQRLIIGSAYGGYAPERVMSAIRQLGGGAKPAEVFNLLHDPTFLAKLKGVTGLSDDDVKGLVGKVIASGVSAFVMAMTKSFPMGAMGYFAVDRLFGGENEKTQFAGWLAGESQLDGMPIRPMGMSIPGGLPNEIFAEYRFICYNYLTGRWYPAEEITPLSFDSNENYMWLALDRVDGKVYKCNWVKKPPRIYV